MVCGLDGSGDDSNTLHSLNADGGRGLKASTKPPTRSGGKGSLVFLLGALSSSESLLERSHWCVLPRRLRDKMSMGLG